jgi:hypothetical protein
MLKALADMGAFKEIKYNTKQSNKQNTGGWLLQGILLN